MRKKEKTPFVNFILFLMFCLLLFLGAKINEKKKWIELPVISTWIPYESWLNDYDRSVSKNIEYHLLTENIYTNGTNTCAVLFDGIVLEVKDDQVTILHDNQVQAVYGHMQEILVKADERILKGQKIGTFEESLTLDFKKDQKVLTYEEVLKL